ncbi:hypothetical protein BGW36DRAFT_410508 [Talaromyces proteolyticus]|uniref:G-protein coupled receptors family 2 profile 2 domain-containing protein n=1 Tax=Talaromyces proteolyticus TaxID=1131652 RepID=A0AAD4PSS8_9EURO|nr:uncharacterized protein BGW36DRAFT_410508 [Talaromyces proteolyticus]KAH8691976.1 hypothetical protein BGW36DRAFT_410508 [Talaromyces proteolyticus]
MSCPEPFISELSITTPGGYIDGRWCKLIGNTSCCFPCPITDWTYSENFSSDIQISSWLGLSVFVLAIAYSISCLVLPKQVTGHHYLNTAPLIGFIFMSVAYWLPLATKPQQCYDSITPHDWKSDVSCAFTSTFLLFGVWVLVISCFFRALSLYLHLRWEKELGKMFMVFSLVVIFVGAAGLLVLAMTLTGASYQIGSICVIDIQRGKGTFWGPLLAIGATTILLQVLLMFYCFRVVLKPLDILSMLPFLSARNKRASVVSQETVMTYTTHITNYTNQTSNSATARQASARVWRILQLQWRAVLSVLLILIHVALLTQMFFQIHLSAYYSLDKSMPWIQCLISAGAANRTKCSSYSSEFGPSETNVVASMCLLIGSGFWGFICVMRISIVTGWLDWMKARKAAIINSVKNSGPQNNDPERAESSMSYCTDTKDPLSPDSDSRQDKWFEDREKYPQVTHEENSISRNYKIPKQSFSAPTSPISTISI